MHMYTITFSTVLFTLQDAILMKTNIRPRIHSLSGASGISEAEHPDCVTVVSQHMCKIVKARWQSIIDPLTCGTCIFLVVMFLWV